MSGVRSSMPSMNYAQLEHIRHTAMKSIMLTAASSPLSVRGRPASKDLHVVFPVCSANLCTRRTVRSETSRIEAISELLNPRAESETICFFTSSGICFRLPMMRSQSRHVYPAQPVAPPDISYKRSVAQSGASSWAFPYVDRSLHRSLKRKKWSRSIVLHSAVKTRIARGAGGDEGGGRAGEAGDGSREQDLCRTRSLENSGSARRQHARLLCRFNVNCHVTRSTRDE